MDAPAKAQAVSVASRSFLKKRTKRLLLLVLAARSRPWPRSWERRREKKSFAAFLQKRRLFFLQMKAGFAGF
jgi:hypothetical protein